MRRLFTRVMRLLADQNKGKRRRNRNRRPMFEPLEERRLLTFLSSGGVLHLTQGSDYSEHVWVQMDSGPSSFFFDDSLKISHNINSSWQSEYHNIYSLAGGKLSQRIKRIQWQANGGHDYFVNMTSMPSHAYGGAGNDTLQGGGGADVLSGGDAMTRSSAGPATMISVAAPGTIT